MRTQSRRTFVLTRANRNMHGPKARNRYQLGVIGVLGVCLLLGCRRPPLQRVDHPETGYAFPAISDIASMDLSIRPANDLLKFPVPRCCWEELLATLSPSQRDQSPIPTRLVLGTLQITTGSGRKHTVVLFIVEREPVGAFSVDSTDTAWENFRGGNSRELLRVVEKLHGLYSSSTSEGKRRDGADHKTTQ